MLDPQELREKFPYTRPSVLTKGPIFGLGYRSPWISGNIIQAKISKKYNLNVMLAQQSAREIERTNRSFKEVVDSATISAYEANLNIPWGADGDHLKTEQELKDAVSAGFTHFTYDVTLELKKGYKETLDKITEMWKTTKQLKENNEFTTEISLDETEKILKIEDIVFLLEELKKRNIKIDEIALRFPGYFEKAIDYYLKIEKGRKIRDTREFELYLKEISKLSKKYYFRVSIHSGSDKFSIYPILAKILKDNFHLKTAGTFYLEELKIVAKHNPDLFKEIFEFSLKQFQKDRATYELSTNIDNIPNIVELNSEELVSAMQSGSGNDDLRQVLHVTYGSVLTAKDIDGKYLFRDRIYHTLINNETEYYSEFEKHLRRHIKYFINFH